MTETPEDIVTVLVGLLIGGLVGGITAGIRTRNVGHGGLAVCAWALAFACSLTLTLLVLA